MTEPSPPQGDPSAPSPFDQPESDRTPFSGPGSSPFQGPGQGPGKSPGPGVGKPLLIGCGVVFLLILVAGILFVANQNRIAAWLFEAMESQLAPALPDDLPADVRQRYDTAFDDAIAAMRAGEYNPFAMQEAQRAFTHAAGDLSGDDAKMTVDDVEQLAAALEKIPADSADEQAAPGSGEDGGMSGADGVDGGGEGSSGTPAPEAGSDAGSGIDV